ncbi:hypothetical protein ACSMXN_24035 [Jatrophihabitans sp. DSM 45814]
MTDDAARSEGAVGGPQQRGAGREPCAVFKRRVILTVGQDLLMERRRRRDEPKRLRGGRESGPLAQADSHNSPERGR